MWQWPLAVWACIAELFRAVEAAGRWPEALRGGVICLLPKAGVQASTVNPLEARPVVLLPLLYRLWAHRRGREIADWLMRHGMEGLPDPSMSAEAYGTLLAAELEQAVSALGRNAPGRLCGPQQSLRLGEAGPPRIPAEWQRPA